MPKDTLLHKAAVEGNMSSVKECIEVDEIDVNAPGANGRTALHRAAGKNRADVVSYLHEKGADINRADSRGWLPLHWAAVSGANEAASALIQNGADFWGLTNSLKTPMHVASEAGRADTLSLLLKSIKDTSGDDGLSKVWEMKDKNQMTICEAALSEEHAQVVELLRSLGDPHALQSTACCKVRKLGSWSEFQLMGCGRKQQRT